MTTVQLDKTIIPSHLLGDSVMATTAALAHLGARIKKIREERGWTLQQLADESGMGKSVVSRIESGERSDPRISTVASIAAALEMTLDELLLGKPQKRPAIKSLLNVRRPLQAALRELDRLEPARQAR